MPVIIEAAGIVGGVKVVGAVGDQFRGRLEGCVGGGDGGGGRIGNFPCRKLI